MSKSQTYILVPDKKGATWDLVMYVPTVVALASIGLKLWYGGGANQSWAYLLFFGASFFFIAGANRVLSTRLMILPSAPTELSVSKNAISVKIKRGDQIELVKDLKYFSDYAGKSFALTGMDLSGKKRQFVFHRGQFPVESEYTELRSRLSVYK